MKIKWLFFATAVFFFLFVLSFIISQSSYLTAEADTEKTSQRIDGTITRKIPGGFFVKTANNNLIKVTVVKKTKMLKVEEGTTADLNIGYLAIVRGTLTADNIIMADTIYQLWDYPYYFFSKRSNSYFGTISGLNPLVLKTKEKDYLVNFNWQTRLYFIRQRKLVNFQVGDYVRIIGNLKKENKEPVINALLIFHLKT